YDLGAVMVTQQPGSIPVEILSQGDNWFIFHLLSAADLTSVQRANAHFSEDLLSSLLNEPIPGQGVFWSSVGGTPYPIPLRVLSSEPLYQARAPEYDRTAADTFACHLRERHEATLAALATGDDMIDGDNEQSGAARPPGDMIGRFQQMAVNALRSHQGFQSWVGQEPGVKWGRLIYLVREALPATLSDRDQIAKTLVRSVLDQLFGPQNVGWVARSVPQDNGKSAVYVLKTPEES